MKKKITFEDAKKRFKDRDDIEIIENEYNGWCKKSKFWDNIEQDYFLSIPQNVFRFKIAHPNRTSTKRKKTNLKKYNVEYNFQSEETKKKTKETCIKKYNVKNPLQSEKIKTKVKQTNLERYLSEWPLSSKTIQDKIKQTNLEKYNVENIFSSIKIQQKIKKTNDNKIFLQILNSKIKTKQTCIDTYNTEHFSKTDKFKKIVSKRWIKEHNIHLSDWVKQQPNLGINYMIFCHNFSNKEISIEELHQFIQNYKNNKTSLEIFTENLFNIKHYNKKPKEITKLYKPDFKLSDKIYLNVDGLYWHTEEQKGRWYHYKLREEFERVGLRIFQFYDYEIYNKSNIVKSIINNSLGIFNEKIDSEKCKTTTLTYNQILNFNNQNSLHFIQKDDNIVHVANLHNNQIVSCLSYKIINNICFIVNYCVKNNIKVNNSLKCLLNYILSYNKEIKQFDYNFNLRYESMNEFFENCFIKHLDKLDFNIIYKNNYKFKIYGAGQRSLLRKVNQIDAIYKNNKNYKNYL